MGAVKSILLGLLLGIVFLIILGISVAYFYEDEVTEYFIDELNEVISTKIQIKNADFSLLRKFPNASIEFQNIVALSPEGYEKRILDIKTDTLFFAERVFVQFNVIELISKNYRIKNIDFDNGEIHLFIDKYGKENYIFLNQEKQDSSQEFNLELKKVKITNSKILYFNQESQIYFKSNIYKSLFKVNLSDKNYILDIQSNQRISFLKSETSDYIIDKNLETDLRIDITDNKIEFKKGELSLDAIKLFVNGFIINEENSIIDLKIATSKQSVKSLYSILPSNFQKAILPIRILKGIISINIHIEGELSKTISPQIIADFEVQNAQIAFNDKDKLIDNIFVKGRFYNQDLRNAELSRIEINQFKLSLQKSTAKGNIGVNGFTDPYININFTAEIDFNELNQIFPLDTIEIIEGRGKLGAEYEGSLNELRNIKFQDLFTKEYNLKLNIKEGKIKLKEHPLVIEKLSGNININKDVYADSLYFKISESDFFIHGEALNLFNYFTFNESVKVKAEIISDLINLNQLSSIFSVEKSNIENPSYQFPNRLNLALDVNIKNFTLGKFEAINIKGRVNYKPRMFTLNEITFNSMDGSAKIGGVIVQNYNSDFLVKSQSRLSGIDINKLFYSFNNFGQMFILEKNIKGDIDGVIFFSSDFSDKIILNKKSVIAESDITISNGALIGFEPLKSLSNYIDVSELENIKFSTLHNQISIKDEQVYIPKMDIQSSAINLSVSGTHNFDNYFEYHFKVLLSDVLAKKAKRKAEIQGAFENVEDDGIGKTNLFLKIKGTPDDYKISYDGKQARESRKEEFKNEKKELKNLLNNEFGWYDSDSSVKINTSKEIKENNFKIEWEEKNTPIEPEEKEVKIESKQKFEIEWNEDSTDNSLK